MYIEFQLALMTWMTPISWPFLSTAMLGEACVFGLGKLTTSQPLVASLVWFFWKNNTAEYLNGGVLKWGYPPNRPFFFGIFRFGVPPLQETTKMIAMFARACRCPKFPHRDCMALVSMGVPCDKRLGHERCPVPGVTQRNDRPSGKETYWGIPRCENQYFWHLLKSMFQRDWCFHGFHGLASHQYPHIRCRLGYSNPSTPCFFIAPRASSSFQVPPRWSLLHWQDPPSIASCSLVPPGKRSRNYGKISHFQWVNQRFLWPFSIALTVFLPEGISQDFAVAMAHGPIYFDDLPSGKHTKSYWTWPVSSGFAHKKWWFSIVM